ncbi:TetR/AcrR family transcriptional regulator [Oerskovia rustica]|uniref:TetR/AcrR family transcriptional regulator n=1 Tax=Oerskovia rustica TaxID=2762237 RepID=A0ABR8RRL3_9CELL|nr:TetR/AcrR family transcriptional regulator [Oerskovia rustica]MBD7950432.1 TetR/AcrR family transcriptional regulator [Oerskovia rustica]
MPPTTRLDAATWVDAAYDAFTTAGLDAVKVEPVARALGATKGSFYWHFADRQALVDAVLARWEAETARIVEEVENTPGSPADQFAALFTAVTRRRSPRTGEQLLYAQTDLPGVAAAMSRVTAQRLDVVTRLLRSAGFSPDEARARATIALATVVGAEHLTLATPDLAPTGDDARAVRELSLAMILGRD